MAQVLEMSPESSGTDAARLEDLSTLFFVSFDAHVRSAPDALALAGDHESATYRELSALVGRIASRLVSDYGIGPGDVVLVVGGRDLASLALLLAVLRVGARAAPLEQSLAVSSDVAKYGSNVRLIVSAEPLDWGGTPVPNACFGMLARPSEPDEAGDLPYQPASLASAGFVLSTSGTTGIPKLILVSLLNFSANLNSANEKLRMSESLRSIWSANFGFDLSLSIVLMTLRAGGLIVVPSSAQVFDPRAFVTAIRKYRVNMVNHVPSFLENIALACEGEEPIAIDYLIFGGEALTSPVVRSVRNLFDARVVANVYGPTETTNFATIYFIDGDMESLHLPIGRALRGYQITLLDEQGKPCDVGVIGEIHIGGVGVASYLRGDNRVFQEATTGGGKVYKTGDMGYVDTLGVIHYCGRIDEQVKLHGKRVDLAGLESLLGQHSSIENLIFLPVKKDGVVVAVCGFYLATDEVPSEAIHDAFYRALGENGLPIRLHRCTEWPHAANGKVDRAALHALLQQEMKQPVATNSLLASEVIRIWSELLDGIPVDPDKTFLELGGGSLKAMLLVKRMKDRCGVEVTLRQLLVDGMTISALVGSIETRADATAPLPVKEG